MTYRSILGLLTVLVAYTLLIPGISEPVVHLKTTLDKSELAVLGKEAILTSGAIPNFLLPATMEVLNQIQVEGQLVIQDTAKSILGTAELLWNDGNRLVALLIIVFSVVVPSLKLLLLSGYWVFKSRLIGQRAATLGHSLSKWSMADVFAMALLMTFLAIDASGGNSALVNNEVTLQNGFYYFLGYCLLSITASQLLTEARISRQS